MKYIEIIANEGCSDTVSAIAEKADAPDFRLGAVGEDGMRQMRMLISDDQLQIVLDTLQGILCAQPTAKIIVLSVESLLPKPDEEKRTQEGSAIAAREAIYEGVEKSTRLDFNFIILVILSTLVAAIGLIENNVAVVIGAMVIAPLLGPNLALSLGTALGDVSLIRKSVKTLFVGILLAVGFSAGLGTFYPSDFTSHELLSRTEPGLDSVVLAFASGAAAALSLTTGLSSVLVGVMVAVALLPPAVTLGIMLEEKDAGLALGAGLLLSVNIVCVNQASKVVFLVKGIRPRIWFEKEKAKRATVIYVLGWLVTLLILTFFIYARL
jgi:uncharacterized hydrophobic protein (TIGR00341 family)